MDRSRYKQAYRDFIGVDMSSDPSAVARNRLSYAVNMWRDYESAQGGCIETFPGYRAVAEIGKKINGIYNFRTRNGYDYLIVHAGRDLYAVTVAQLAAVGGVLNPEIDKLLENTLEDGASTGYLFNNNLYILDGSRIIEVKAELSAVGIESLAAGEIVGYIPTTYYDGKPYEQRNMLSEYAYEVALSYVKNSEYDYSDNPGADADADNIRYVHGMKGDEKNNKSLRVIAQDLRIMVESWSFANNNALESVYIEGKNTVKIGNSAFRGCKSLKNFYIYIRGNETEDQAILRIYGDAFTLTENLEKIYVFSDNPNLIVEDGYIGNGFVEVIDSWNTFRTAAVNISEVAEGVEEVRDYDNDTIIDPGFYTVNYDNREIGGETTRVVESVLINGDNFPRGIKLKLKVHPTHFSTIAGADNFFEGNKEYKSTGREALNGCTKCAVFDGRVFLTGNPELPNTVFYNQRNLTGASDPTYFGAYNYINDGTGNTPNVELLATPSYLMVLKQDTVQEGSIYYHTPADNTHSDQVIRNLLPRIYPSISGAAGIGSAGDTVPGATVCNFLDDPVFLSKRGLEAVGKEMLNLERTVTHRSSNVDRLLIKENLSRADLAEWKGYLMILVNGNVYMADSRSLAQHPDGSYQYEWFYLTGVGAYESYTPRFRYCTSWPMTDLGIRLNECVFETHRVDDVFKISAESGYADVDIAAITEIPVWGKREGEFEYNEIKLYEVGGYRGEDGEYVGGYVVEQIDDELCGRGIFFGADKMAVVGERLFFGTENGYLLCVNTDMRDGEGIIPRDAYTFNGVAYESGCATRLDDCGQMGLAKCTVPGTVVAEFKMMPGSKCHVRVSLNGRDFKDLTMKGITSSRFDFGGFDFSTFAFNENENNIAVLREMTRNFVRKQYYIYSDGFKEPFGFSGLSYNYYVKGKIRF